MVDELLSLQKLSIEETNYRLVAENPEGFWSLPWLTPISLKVFPELQVQNFIWISCEWPSIKDLMAWRARSKKVILAQVCEDKKLPVLVASLLHRGFQFFSLDNKDLNVILVNLEGLEYLVKRDPNLLTKKVVTDRPSGKKSHFLSTIAGWKSALWNTKYRAYEVHATIDVVEWFKLPENVWPNFQ